MNEFNFKNEDASTFIVVKWEELQNFANYIIEQIQPQSKPSQTNAEENEFLSSKLICKRFSIDRTTLHRWVKLDYVTSYKIGTLIRYSKKQIESLITKTTDKNGNSKN